MFDVPKATAVTTPQPGVPGATVATVVLLLVHAPPAGVAHNVAVFPTHNEPGRPDVTVGNGFTVTTAVTEQPSAEV